MLGKSKVASLATAAAMAGLIGGAGVMVVGCHGTDTNHNDASHNCKGQNACKGQGNCKTADHACKGQNACKGQGACKSS